MSFLNLDAWVHKKVVRRPSYSLSGLPQPCIPYAEVCAQWRILLVYNFALKIPLFEVVVR